MTEQTSLSPEGQSNPHLHQPMSHSTVDAPITPALQEDHVRRLRRMYDQIADQPIPERLLSLFSGKV
jgi:hypothetical protein